MPKRFGQLCDLTGRLDLVRRRQDPLDGVPETEFGDHRRGDERQATSFACGQNQRGFDVSNTIRESAVVAGTAIMQFVRVEHKRMPGEAASRLAPIAEDLNTARGETDAIGIVPVRRKRLSDESSMHRLNSGRRPLHDHGAPQFRSARTIFQDDTPVSSHYGGRTTHQEQERWTRSSDSSGLPVTAVRPTGVLTRIPFTN